MSTPKPLHELLEEVKEQVRIFERPSKSNVLMMIAHLEKVNEVRVELVNELVENKRLRKLLEV
jgi:hypothetical protein